MNAHSTFNLQHSTSNRRGQSLILAIVIMFLLSFLGVIFIAMVTRNLFRAGRSSEMLKVEQLARAGIEYADMMLTRSEEGADWRPEPEFATIAAPAALYPNDPDGKWVYLPLNERFSRISSGQGRFLLRVSYNPDPRDPLSKYIKIESIGRIGAVDRTDPTTMAIASKHLLRYEMTAYKPIGVTDYCRFVTNKEKRATQIDLGFPGFDVKFGDQGNGAPIRVNGNLVWNGKSVDIYLRSVANTPARPTDPVPPLPIDTVDVAGEISHADLPSGRTIVNLHRIDTQPVDASFPPDLSDVPPSTGAFDTFYGFYRDGSDDPEPLPSKRPRAIRRIEAPLLDLFLQSSKTMRYRALTRNSGEWLKDDGGNYTGLNSGFFGWGRGLYVDNFSDVQGESETLIGGRTLRADWMRANNEMSPYWRGPFYVPPGVQITFNGDLKTEFEDTNGKKYEDYYITLTRTDVERGGVKRVWLDPKGNPRPGWGQTINMPYPANGVIFAEGNIRIKGMLPPEKHAYPPHDNRHDAQLTIVSGATIYIEGNILKYRDPRRSRDVRLNPDPTCAISLLAEDYVCINTTQFVSLLTETGPTSIGSDPQTGEPPFHLIVTPEPSSNFRCAFSFGPADYLLGTSFSPFLCVRHAGQYGSSYINLWVNRGDDINVNYGLYNNYPIGAPPPPWPSWVYGLADPLQGGPPGVGIGTVFEHNVFRLDMAAAGVDAPVGLLTPDAGYMNLMELGLDQTSIARNNYLLSGFVIQPMDIVIEAIIYAQNKSFFVIPGPWFNPNPDDTPENFTSPSRGYRPLGTRDEFPYFGDPLDIKITLNGAVTENLPASAGDVSEWASKWCGIPEKYGSSSTGTKHPGQGISFMYDEIIGCPRDPDTNLYLRVDGYGRALPITPNLPVSPTLIFYGQPV
ncbi:MAG: hypothetical protein Q7T82_14125 [Armatimonadota bacterium]|nr:hypothetical protein [Armatimonadota bacterium]